MGYQWTEKLLTRHSNQIAMNHIIEYYKGKRGGFYIRIKARNGKIVADGGEAYSTISNVRRAALRLQKSISTAKIIHHV